MAARLSIVPVSMNQFSLAATPGAFATTPATGVDAAGSNSAFATAWSGAASGLQFQNNGLVWLWIYNGVTACTAYALVGQKAEGQVLPYTTYSYTLPTSGYCWLGPWDPTFNQQDQNQFNGGSGGASPGGLIGAGGQGLMCVDFSVTTTVAARAYQIVPA